jgi:lipoprotein-anchoring transpeptidase ErfK/SrfK
LIEVRKGISVMKRVAFGFSLALAASLGLASPAAAANDGAVALETAAATLAPNNYVWADPGTAEPVTVIVSIPLQRAYVYRGQTLIAASSVSTGKEGKDTPTGVFPILQKKQMHHSNLYDSAPMPFMQRLTWDGVALHAGKNPGFPASHGCVRLPTAFAKKLFEVTSLGSTVVVTDEYVDTAALDPELLRTDAMRANEAQLAALPR